MIPIVFHAANVQRASATLALSGRRAAAKLHTGKMPGPSFNNEVRQAVKCWAFQGVQWGG
jgi:hypothetical protein